MMPIMSSSCLTRPSHTYLKFHFTLPNSGCKYTLGSGCTIDSGSCYITEVTTVLECWCCGASGLRWEDVQLDFTASGVENAKRNSCLDCGYPLDESWGVRYRFVQRESDKLQSIFKTASVWCRGEMEEGWEKKKRLGELVEVRRK